MRFRLGYVAITISLKDCSPSKTVTATAYEKLKNDEAKKYRLERLTRENLKNTLRILTFNKAYNIKVFRITSKIVPLATHPLTNGWDYVSEFADEFSRVGKFILDNNIRVSAHPDHFTIINSPSRDILHASIRDLEYHVNVFEAMGLNSYKYKLVLHVGGLYKDKKLSMERFKRNFVHLPDRIRKRIILENDDKSYTASDVLEMCRELGIPMVVDVHHHRCVNNGEKLEDLLPLIFDTWNGEELNPKVHFSSPRSTTNFRSHADYIDFEEFMEFINIASTIKRDFDVMLEAKNKEQALLKLSKELQKNPRVRCINKGEFELV